jgi:uroporphyrinogen decarboxylase
MMRQAGRYLPEYQAVRQKADFLTVCKTPDLAVEVSLQPWRRFAMDGVIVFSDILIPLEAMGTPLVFRDPGGPHLPQPVRSVADAERLGVPDPHDTMGFVMQALATLRQSLPSEVGVLGFAGAPWTLASYLVEGGTSRNFTHLKAWLYDDPASLHRLLTKLADVVTVYLNAQIEAGADVVQLFDTWAGILSPSLYRQWVLPYHQRILAGLNRHAAPVVLFVNGSAHVLEMLVEAGPDVISLDTAHDLAVARRSIGPDIAVQGNLDPNALFAHADVAVRLTDGLLAAGGTQGYVFNLGHGVLPKTPVETVARVIERVRSASQRECTPTTA